VSSIRFLPWKGGRYESSPLFGRKVLVLGESHYQWDKEKPIDEWDNLTIECIREQISGEATFAFWTNIAVAFLNRRPTLAEKESFWHSVAFYNYIQFSVGLGPRVPPTREMWRDSEPGFVQVLNNLKPDVIVVLGYALWKNLPELGGKVGPIIAGADQPDTWRYPYEGRSALAYAILHPSSGGFSGYYWHPYVMRAIELA